MLLVYDKAECVQGIELENNEFCVVRDALQGVESSITYKCETAIAIMAKYSFRFADLFGREPYIPQEDSEKLRVVVGLGHIELLHMRLINQMERYRVEGDVLSLFSSIGFERKQVFRSWRNMRTARILSEELRVLKLALDGADPGHMR